MNKALSNQQPWLEWAEKKEQYDRGWFEVDPVALHIHERVSAQAIVRAAMREDLQRNLFADPQLPYQKEIQFYQHDVDWTNRLILGDSLQVMSSLARRENLAGKVQMIYIDPPYGINYSSNFQSEIGKREVKDKDDDLSREPEMIKAFRDTWELGVHSYLGYLRSRFIVARELLSTLGSIFIQISDQNLHRVCLLLDEVFGKENFCRLITFRKKNMPLGSRLLESTCDYIVWYAKDKAQVKFHPINVPKEVEGDAHWNCIELESGQRRKLSPDEIKNHALIPQNSKLYRYGAMFPAGTNPSGFFDIDVAGNKYAFPEGKGWKTNPAGMKRLLESERVEPWQIGKTLGYIIFFADSPVTSIADVWNDTALLSGKVFVVQTSTTAIERCMLMTSDPGDLVLDPTCGSGTTALVAERWGRRWITIDTSRISISIARQRLLTAKYEYYRLRDELKGVSGQFVYRTVPSVTLKDIAHNYNLDAIFDKHKPILVQALENCNQSLSDVSNDLRAHLKAKLIEKQKIKGKRAITDADQRRWELPKEGEQWQDWEVPIDTDPEWPNQLKDAIKSYWKAWQAKMDEVNVCISANADKEELVDKPETVKGIIRVSGPFTVEGVRPEELSIGEERFFDNTPNEWEKTETDQDVADEVQNVRAYLSRMVGLIRKDGITFPNNQHQDFGRLEPLYEESTGTLIHAEAIWNSSEESESNNIGITFGPQYGPVTAEQVGDIIRAGRRYDELVIAGFSFDAAALDAIKENQHPKQKIHIAHIRPDVSQAMDGLLKDTPDSQLFTVFGQPEIKVRLAKEGEYIVELLGVDIYDPLKGEVRSSKVDKVTAWFLDSDYDGRCFCITQAFFPDQNSWDKIAKSLGSQSDPEAFEAYKGTISIPFKAGKHKRIAVKVIDPRGNEVMAAARLNKDDM